MKNRIHLTFDNEANSMKVFQFLKSPKTLSKILGGGEYHILEKPHVEIEGFVGVHDLHSLEISTVNPTD